MFNHFKGNDRKGYKILAIKSLTNNWKDQTNINNNCVCSDKQQSLTKSRLYSSQS